MRSWLLVICSAAAVCLTSACVDAPTVIQGAVVGNDEAAQTIVVRDERPPHDQVVIALAGSEVGADLHPGDEVRVAYVAEGERLRAVRVMNLTRQAEVGKKAKPAADLH